MVRLADRWAERTCSGNIESIADDWWDKAFVDAALAAGIGDLAHVQLPEGTTEVRIWAGAGAFARQPMLRLQRSAKGGVRGDLYIHYPADWAMDGNADGRELRRFMRANCRSISIGADRAVCHARFAREPDWRAIYRRFEKRDLLTLPDEATLPKVPPNQCILISDGNGMDVEVRQGGTYRRYAYSSNGCVDSARPEEAASGAILDEVLRLHWGLGLR